MSTMANLFDDDFFDIDEDILNATGYFGQPDENKIDEPNESNQLRYFNCLGEDVINKNSFHPESFIECGEINLILNENTEFCGLILFNLNISDDVLIDPKMLQDLVNKSRINAQTLIASSRPNSTFVTRRNFFELRKQITIFLFQLRKLIYSGLLKSSKANEIIRPIAIYFDHLSALPIADILHNTHSTIGNESNSPAYHLFHGHLEWRWFYLTIKLKTTSDTRISNQMNDIENLKSNEIEEILTNLIFDLILISSAKFNKLAITELPLKTPFVCVCNKELWLMIQLMIEKYHYDGIEMNKFWFYFNNVVKSYRERKDPYTNNQNNVTRDSISIYPNNFVLFGIWLLNGVNSLLGYTENGFYHGSSSSRSKDNFEMLESLLRSFISSECIEQNLRSCLLIVNNLLTEWWIGKTDLLMIFWEYFHKKLNSSFFVSGSTPNSIAVTSNSAQGYIEQIHKLLDANNLNTNMASFSIFLHMLGKVLKKLQHIEMRNQMQKIMGRIFTKFSEAKMLALNEIGIHNLINLFLTLAVNGDIRTIHSQLQSIFLMLKLEKLQIQRQTCAVKGHLALIFLFTQDRIDANAYITRMLEQIQKIPIDDNKLKIFRIMAESCEPLLNRQDIFECGEFTMIESWIADFLNICSKQEQEKCLQLINNILIKINNPELHQKYGDKYMKLIHNIFRIILPYVKKIFRQSDALGVSAEIASTFCLLATGKNGLPTFDDLFKYFTEASCCDAQTTTKFLVSILSTDKITKINDVTILRLWIKCSTLSSVTNEDIRQLTKIVVHLFSFKELCDTDEEDILDAREPLSPFFASCGKRYNNGNEEERKKISNILQNALYGFEKWIPMTESPPAIMKIHIVIGLIIFNCSRIVYVHSKPLCFFNVIINHYILPLQLMMGKQQKSIAIQAVHKIWHLIVGGIEQLEYKNDAHLQKILTDLVIKWIPQFRTMNIQKIISKPFIAIFLNCNNATIHFIFDKIATTFLSSRRRDTHQNAEIVAVIIKEVLFNFKNDPENLKCLVNATCLTMLEHLMMVDDEVPSKPIIFELFTELLKSTPYLSSSDIKECVLSNFRTLATKHLSYYSLSYFTLMIKFAKIDINLVKELLNHIVDQVGKVERIRGVIPDAKLRSLLLELQKVLK